MAESLLVRKQTSFALFCVGNRNPPPDLIIGQLQLGTPITFINQRRFTLQAATGFSDLWEIPAANCNLSDGQTYHYWFEVL